MEEKALLRLLKKDQREEYLRERDKKYYELDIKYENENGKIILGIQNQLNCDKRHRDMVNTCIFPFSCKCLHNGLKYHFLRASPLSELNGHKNMDFLLGKKKNNTANLIFGECKGGDGDIKVIVEEVLDKVDAVKKNENYIKKEYLNFQSDDVIQIEYVIVVPEGRAPRFINEVMDQGGKLIIWSVPLTGEMIVRSQLPHSSYEHAVQMNHADINLKRGLERGLHSNARAFSFLPDMPPILEQMALIQIANDPDNPRVIDEKALFDLLKIELFYMSDEYIKYKIQSMIKFGTKIKYLKYNKKTQSMKIVTKSIKPTSMEQSLLDKWTNYQLNEMKSEEKEVITRDLIKEWLVKVRKKGESLDDYS